MVGETPNLAARLQALAAPNTLVIGEATRRQVGGLFDLADLGPQALAGFAEPQSAWRVVGESGMLSRFEALRSGETPLVGRDEEIALLIRRWQQANHAIALHDRFPLLTGPPSGRVSPSGRQVVFTSYASLVAGDGNTTRDIYVMDVSTRRVTLETPGAGGHSANGESVNPDISRDGRFVVFESTAGNLTNVEFARGIPRVFLRDRQTDIIRLLSTNARDEPANGPSMNPAISADGEAVVFVSSASDILEDTAGIRRVPDPTRIEYAHTSGRDEPGTGAERSERVTRDQRRRPLRGLHVESRSDAP